MKSLKHLYLALCIIALLCIPVSLWTEKATNMERLTPTAAAAQTAASKTASSARSKLKTVMPRFQYGGKDPIEKLVYETEIDRGLEGIKPGMFSIVSPIILNVSQEGNFLKVFLNSSGSDYTLWNDHTITQDSCWGFPTAITYQKQANGSYALLKYDMPQDGEGFYPRSIHNFCTTPATHKEIPGLAERMMNFQTSVLIPLGIDRNYKSYLDKNKIKGYRLITLGS